MMKKVWNGILTHATTEMSLEDVRLSERSQTQTSIIGFYLKEVSGIVKHIETKSRIVVARGWGKGEKGVSVSWVQGLDNGDDCTTM